MVQAKTPGAGACDVAFPVAWAAARRHDREPAVLTGSARSEPGWCGVTEGELLTGDGVT
jgi:hypothetical protein